jgi:hypothetical protein
MELWLSVAAAELLVQLSEMCLKLDTLNRLLLELAGVALLLPLCDDCDD